MAAIAVQTVDAPTAGLEQVLYRLQEKRIALEKVVLQYGEAPAGIKEVFELCRGFERAYTSFINESPVASKIKEAFLGEKGLAGKVKKLPLDKVFELKNVKNDEFPGIFRFTGSVFPSEEDDVVTSPYNAMLALAQLVEGADCVLPVENQALIDIVNRGDAARERAEAGSASGAAPPAPASSSTPGAKPFDGMNGVAASLLLHLTASVRFEGPLNVDLNDITMNLVPYPRMHFLLSSMSPLTPPAKVRQGSRHGKGTAGARCGARVR
ncbi:Tubulin epsilon chain [Tetrabaena socialis]|uniref:Tubulin epsilon chain n=1 Tax=Tetrabaena socialis TaxID=47790 RepID=A0A2J8A0Y3_9CHLO|nr:Tubulin epsilon chain [Tetrabaena socialis]|eukprot:PNH06176.1 Tubulin epsilon chain [Tetrabaena socialis]